MGARLLAVLAGLDLGLGWVPADGVSPRLAAAVAAVALLVVVTGRPWGSWARPRRLAGHLDAASALALGTTVLAGAGAAFAPPDFGPDPARTAWLVVAVAAGVAMLGLSLPPRPAGAQAGGPRLTTSPGRGGDQSRTRSYR
ncbi:hypothetical protein [Pseudofrankia inefficax]|uniref:Glycosyl transferase domain-containing protein n=1 Tax=Pseudofrankia inefficax (strain DSM 45817 / CECT 9037 / DDB 130130 / EuI1c) TaxID=298654 RepID=E3JBF8_PSEI1|nr:hypothetical protein [Pseudofrankia inefficax]ADP79830.1 glycosyl transferase domain-containing protein [Pseudofrankia inefficax]